MSLFPSPHPHQQSNRGNHDDGHGQDEAAAAAGELAGRVDGGEHADRVQHAGDDQHDQERADEAVAGAARLEEGDDDQRQGHIFDEVAVRADAAGQPVVTALADQGFGADPSGHHPAGEADIDQGEDRGVESGRDGEHAGALRETCPCLAEPRQAGE